MEQYIRAEMKIVEVDVEDIITTSCSNDTIGSFDGEWVLFPWSGC